MYCGKKFDVKFFHGKLELAAVEGSIDDRGCHFIFVKTATQIRTSQLHAAINEYNSIVPSGMGMRLQEGINKPAIVTMSSKRMNGSIYLKIANDKQAKCEGRTSNYWYWDPKLDERRLAMGISTGTIEFDVIKKRRAMETPNTNEEDESSAEALAAFEEFERSVLPALESIKADEDDNRRMEMIQMEDDMLQEKTPTTGGVYFAWSDCLGCMKVGATRKESPLPRLQQLSRHVTSPFTLVVWLPSAAPFRLEAAAHLHFKEKRINARNQASGAGTEFFCISAGEAEEWVGRLI